MSFGNLTLTFKNPTIHPLDIEMPVALDSDISLLIRDDSKLVALLISSLIFLVLLAAVVIMYIALEARRISNKDISQWRRPVPRGPDVAKGWGDHSVWFQEHQLKSYTDKFNTPVNTLQPNISIQSKSIQI